MPAIGQSYVISLHTLYTRLPQAQAQAVLAKPIYGFASKG